MRGTFVHLVAAAALAAGIALLMLVPGVFATEPGGSFTVIAPAKRPLRTVVYAGGARRHARAPRPATSGSAPPAGAAVAVASRPHAHAAPTRGAVIHHATRPAQPRTLAGEPVRARPPQPPFRRRDDPGDERPTP